MKNLFYAFFLLCATQTAFAQAENNDTKIFCLMPMSTRAQFPGGEKALMQYLAENIVYPESATKNCIEGKVFTRFCIAEDGCVENIQIIRGLSDDINAEVIRVLSQMPVWEPGCINDKLERVNFSLPIHFSL